MQRYTYDMASNPDNSPDATNSRCAVCNATFTAGSGYIIRIDIFADPACSDSAMSDEAADIKTLAQLIKQIKSMSVDALQDGVHRRFEYHICPHCQPKLLANPLGLPRISHNAAN